MDVNDSESGKDGFAASWILGLNLLIACAAQIAATLALLDDLSTLAVPR